MNRRGMDAGVVAGAVVVGVVVVATAVAWVLVAALVRSYEAQVFDGLSFLMSLAAIVLIVAAVFGLFDGEGKR